MKQSIIALMLFASVHYSKGENRPVPFPVSHSFKAVADQSFAFIRVHRMADDASVNWGITNPLEAAYFVIERSEDGSYFQTVTEMQATGAASFRYRDASAVPGFSYYRVLCVNRDGSVSQSETIELRIVKRK